MKRQYRPKICQRHKLLVVSQKYNIFCNFPRKYLYASWFLSRYSSYGIEQDLKTFNICKEEDIFLVVKWLSSYFLWKKLFWTDFHISSKIAKSTIWLAKSKFWFHSKICYWSGLKIQSNNAKVPCLPLLNRLVSEMLADNSSPKLSIFSL